MMIVQTLVIKPGSVGEASRINMSTYRIRFEADFVGIVCILWHIGKKALDNLRLDLSLNCGHFP